MLEEETEAQREDGSVVGSQGEFQTGRTRRRGCWPNDLLGQGWAK